MKEYGQWMKMREEGTALLFAMQSIGSERFLQNLHVFLKANKFLYQVLSQIFSKLTASPPKIIVSNCYLGHDQIYFFKFFSF